MIPFRYLVPGFLAALTACGGDPSGPSSGSLAVSVSGLPAGTSAAVTVTGPGGYSHNVAASETIAGLAPGDYTVGAAAVVSNGQSYQPAQPTQSVPVGHGSAAASANVAYALAGATLNVAIAGLSPGVAAAVDVTGPGGYHSGVTATTSLPGLEAGVYTVTAQSVDGGGTSYDPSPATQSVNLGSAGSGSANVSYTQASSAGFNLRIDGMYVTQSVQRYTGDVPLVKDRDGFLRVFVTANGANLAAPAVRVHFYQSGTQVSELTIQPSGPSVPRAPDEGSLSASWNVQVPKSLIQPGLSILAEVDPLNAVAEADETDNTFPSSGTPLAMTVRTTSPFSVRLIPVTQRVNGRKGNVTPGNLDSFLTATMSVHPLAGYDAELGPEYITDAPALVADNGNKAWNTILNELAARRVADGSPRHYFGVVNPSYNGGVAGIGIVGGMTAMGWDRPGADLVAAHEWGHNWGRTHAPCGDPPDPDAGFPYAGGSIGVYGFDLTTQRLMPRTSADLMGYCRNEWISDYTYLGVLDYRVQQPDVAASFAQALQPCLLVWGRVVSGQAVLEPAFQVITRPVLPQGTGPYTLEGRSADGSRLFHLSFAAEQVADDRDGDRQFAFAIPLAADQATRLDLVRLAVPGRPEVSLRAAPAAVSADARSVVAARIGVGRVALQWDASTHPMAMVRDPATAQVLSFARGGHAEIATDRGDLEVQLSNGLGGRSVRIAVPSR